MLEIFELLREHNPDQLCKPWRMKIAKVFRRLTFFDFFSNFFSLLFCYVSWEGTPGRARAGLLVCSVLNFSLSKKLLAEKIFLQTEQTAVINSVQSPASQLWSSGCRLKFKISNRGQTQNFRAVKLKPSNFVKFSDLWYIIKTSSSI